MDAIECGIVKLPRVPVADNIAQDVPRYRELWKNIKSKMPKKGRGKGGQQGSREFANGTENCDRGPVWALREDF